MSTPFCNIIISSNISHQIGGANHPTNTTCDNQLKISGFPPLVQPANFVLLKYV
jgi:hypothetical protein